MIVRSLLTFVVLFYRTVDADRGHSCVAPNGKPATCVPLKNCEFILKEALAKSISALEFAKKYSCGYDAETMVCCEYPDTTTTSLKAKPVQNTTICGVMRETDRIFGGTITKIDEFPWMTALEYENRISRENSGIRCAGSILNSRYVLTAAACITDSTFELINVWLGEWRISTDPDCVGLLTNLECANPVQKVKIKEQIPHPFYTSSDGNNDIGLIQLDKEIMFNDFIRPICLPTLGWRSPKIGTYMTVAGWGVTKSGTASDYKLKVDVPLVSQEICRKKLPNRIVTPDEMCVGGEDEKDSCHWDAGAGLMSTHVDELTQELRWYEEGIVSWGEGCGRVGYPAVYTRVSRYLSWITNIIYLD